MKIFNLDISIETDAAKKFTAQMFDNKTKEHIGEATYYCFLTHEQKTVDINGKLWVWPFTYKGMISGPCWVNRSEMKDCDMVDIIKIQFILLKERLKYFLYHQYLSWRGLFLD